MPICWSPPSRAASSLTRCASTPATKAPRSGSSFPCSRRPEPRDFSFCSPAFPKASSITSKPARCVPAISISASSICPRVKQIRVTYHYPAWTGMSSVGGQHGGDLRAVEGTQAELEISMDRPLHDGLLVLDNDQQLHLSGGQGNVYKGTVNIDKDGAYHVADARSAGKRCASPRTSSSRQTKPPPPDVAIARPGGDYRASPIEEVTVAAKADDPFGLSEFSLHYSVNGGPEQSVNLLKQKGAKDGGRLDHLVSREFQTRPGRPCQSLRHGERRPCRIPHGHVLHSGRSFRARVLAIAAIAAVAAGGGGGRKRSGRNLSARKGDHRGHLEAVRRQRCRRQSRRERQVPLRRAIQASRSGSLALWPPANARPDRAERGIHRFPEGHERRGRRHGSGVRKAATAEMERRHS